MNRAAEPGSAAVAAHSGFAGIFAWGARARGWLPYVAAMALAVAATVLRLGFLHVLGTRNAFLTFYPAVVLAALYGGLPAGVLAAILSAGLADYFFIKPVHQFAIVDTADWLSLGIFLINCVIISWIAQAMHRARVRARHAEVQAATDAARRHEAEARALLGAVVESSDDAILSKDMNGTIQSWNAGAESMFGYRADEIIGQSIALLIPPELLEEEDRIIQRIRRGEKIGNYETVRVTKDGRRLDTSVTESPIKDSHGRIVGASKTVRDVTRRNRAEQALRESQERLQLFIEHSPVSLAMFDRQMRYVSVSRRWLSDYGLGGRDLRGLSHYEVFPEVPERWKEVHQRGLAGEILKEEADRFERADGSVQWLRWEVRPWHDADGQVGGIIVFSEDITERRQKEERLRQLNRTLKALSDGNQAMIHARNEAQYLEEVCQIIVQDCGHAMVWIGFAEEDAARSVRPAASAGLDEGYLETLRISWADTERGRGPTGTAIRTGKPCVCRCMQTDSGFAPWRQEALKRGYASSLVLPLLAEGKAFGAVTLYSKQPDPFSEDEVKLLSELAGNLAQGITALRLRAERARAEEQLRLLSSAVKSAANGIAITDREGRILWTNPAFTGLTGYTPEETVGKNPRLLKSGNTPSEFYQQMWTTILARRVWHGELVNKRKDGSLYSEEMTITPVTDAGGAITHFVAVKQDISERKQAEEALRESNLRLDLLADTASNLLKADSPQRIVKEVCERVMAFLDCQAFFNFVVDEDEGRLRLNVCSGIPEEEIRKFKWLDFGAGVSGCAARDGCRIVAADILSTPDPRTELVKSCGMQAYACHPLMAQGRVLGTLSFGARSRTRFTDDELSLMKAVADQLAIAMERQRTQEKLRHTAEELGRSNQELQQFAYVASHDLQEPLRAVAGYVRLIEERFRDLLDERGRRHLLGAIQGAERMHTLINDLLELSRVGTRGTPFRPADLNSALDIALSYLSARAGESGATIHHDPLPTLRVDPIQMTALFQNLVGNAIKFRSEQPPEIHIGAREQSGQWVFEVRDNGIGIESQYFDRIFQIFQRLHTRNEHAGNGIGLAVCKKIVERHGGKIWVESEPRRGSTFYFTVSDGSV